MDIQMLPYLFGVSEYTASALRMGRLPSMLGQQNSQSLFSGQLAEQLANRTTGTGETTDALSESWWLNHQRMDALKEALLLSNHAQSKSVSNDTALEDTETAGTGDIELNTAPAVDNGPVLESNGTVNGLTAREIVFATANSNANLLNLINKASTYKERIAYVEQLRDKIVNALKAEGYNAYDIGKPDKISIEGSLYDVVRASRGMGKDASVQFMHVPVSTQSSRLKEEIFSAGEGVMDLLTRISSSTDAAERRDLAMQFRDEIVSKLNEKGIGASAGSSPDKISIDGTTYDILRNFNTTGGSVWFQAMKV